MIDKQHEILAVQIEAFAESNPKCLLCQKACHVVGVFIPNRDKATKQRFHVAPNKRRFVLYALCEVCFKKDKVQDLVESVIENNPQTPVDYGDEIPLNWDVNA